VIVRLGHYVAPRSRAWPSGLAEGFCLNVLVLGEVSVVVMMGRLLVIRCFLMATLPFRGAVLFPRILATLSLERLDRCVASLHFLCLYLFHFGRVLVLLVFLTRHRRGISSGPPFLL
jgi:hypothetical protein